MDIKSHYFLGNVFSDETQIEILKNIQEKMINEYDIQNYHTNDLFFTNILYLGYFDRETAEVYMDKIVKYLLTSLQKKYRPIECHYTRFKVFFDKKVYKLSLVIDDQLNIINKVILPYLYENGVQPVYEKRRYAKQSDVSLVFYKYSSALKNIFKKKYKRNHFKSHDIPETKFLIDNISLIKGTPIQTKIGSPSVHDEMNFEVVQEHIYPLRQ